MTETPTGRWPHIVAMENDAGELVTYIDGAEASRCDAATFRLVWGWFFTSDGKAGAALTKPTDYPGPEAS